MPLKGSVSTAPAAPQAADVTVTQTAPAPKPATKAVMTKDDYWTRKEERDIRNGQCIRLSGVLQALLGSVNYGQYSTASDKASYIAQVKADAKELAKFITEEA